MATSDDKLVARAVGGDRDALSVLLDRFGARITSRLNGQMADRRRNGLDIDDVMQVTYLEAFLHIDELSGSNRRAFCAWLTRIAENNLRDAIRGLESENRARPGKRRQTPPDQESFVGLFELVGGTGTTPSRAAVRSEIQELIEAAVRKLPTDYAKVIRLYDLEGQSAAEVAERMGRSRGAVYMLHARALGRLQELMGSESKFFSDSP